ncbi:melanophilin isoform X2 [Macrotis lagotis]|uniref:melanophilin isoform X2 n=1 Tax=Macrotis lagotis TaxID=92651 RepID=UPI003D69E81F
MGRKLDLSKLTDEEAKHVWEVVQRDFDLRKKEEERLEELKGKIQKESTKKELLSHQVHLNETHCGHCLQPYRFLINNKRQCLDCHLYSCKNCGSYNHREQAWVCDPCRLARVVKTGSLEWYYEHVRARFKRFGSAKVMHSLYGRLQPDQDGSLALGLPSRAFSLPNVSSGAQLSPLRGSGESEQTSEAETLDGVGAQHPNKEKRLLPVHPFDFEVDPDYSAQSPPQSPPQSLQLSPTPTTLDGLQILSDDPSANDEEAASLKDALITNAGLTPKAQDFLPEQTQSSPEVSLLMDSSIERTFHPDGEAKGSDQSQLQDFADVDTSDEDVGKAYKMAAQSSHHSEHKSWASSQEIKTHSETEISDMNRRILAIECLLAGLEERILLPWEQSFGSETHTDADTEEEALKRKLGELTSKVSDKGGSSEEEEEGQCGFSPGPDPGLMEAQQAGSTHEGENRLLDLEEQCSQTRTPDSALSELEDRVALTATEVQLAKREVSDIKSRIASLSAAGLPVKTWEKPRKKTNLQIFPLQSTKSNLQDEDPELSGANKVMSRPHIQKRIFNKSLKLQGKNNQVCLLGEPRRGRDFGDKYLGNGKEEPFWAFAWLPLHVCCGYKENPTV